MYCVVSSCNSLLREVREWYAVAGVKKELSNFTAIKSMSLYLWMGEQKSQTSECRERTGLGNKFPHLLPSPLTLLRSCTRLGYCHYPWNCQPAASITYAAVHWCSEAHQWSRSVYWTTLCFLAGSESPHMCLREHILPAPWNASATVLPISRSPSSLVSLSRGMWKEGNAVFVVLGSQRKLFFYGGKQHQ